VSAYIVNDETISVIVKGFVEYDVDYTADDYRPDRCSIGQSLLNQNYKSVNYRYNESTKPHSFQYTNININEGMLLGCIDCYEYQACETLISLIVLSILACFVLNKLFLKNLLNRKDKKSLGD